MTTDRSTPPVRRRRKHAARRTRWAVLGVSGATTAALVGSLGLADRTGMQTSASSGLAGAPSEIVVSPEVPPPTGTATLRSKKPIQLSAPSVRRLDRAPAASSTAATHGSR